MIKRLRQIKEVRVFVWNTINGLITLVSTVLLASQEPMLIAFAPVIMALLSAFTKYINTTYFHDLGVTTK